MTTDSMCRNVFSGSYDAADVEFLLKPVTISATSVAEKEALIQSGRRHYSEMIGHEAPPTPEYETIFEKAMQAGAARLGREAVALAKALRDSVPGPVTLVSLVRAGVPLGVLLHRTLARLGVDVAHFGVSIIRDRGIDRVAMEEILSRRPASGVVFVDGWTGKGAIATEIERSVPSFGVETRLVVGADPCGRAWLAASGEDWLIPSGILGATVSGLVSRTILNGDVVGPGDYHGCMLWEHLREFDRSKSFVDAVWTHAVASMDGTAPAVWTDDDRARRSAASRKAVGDIAAMHAVTNMNRVKPGIAEATRAILRRVPERVFVSDPSDSELAALIHLAERVGAPVETPPFDIAPYRAITLIKAVA
jgi:hypothetical protein